MVANWSESASNFSFFLSMAVSFVGNETVKFQVSLLSTGLLGDVCCCGDCGFASPKLESLKGQSLWRIEDSTKHLLCAESCDTVVIAVKFPPKKI